VSQKKIFIHVGLPKTASTYLQRKFFPNLNKTCFISRPYTQENVAFNSLQYADSSIYEETLMRAEIDRIIDHAGDDDCVLFSDERFTGSTAYGFENRGSIGERLSRILPDAEIILFLRGQEELILSLYGQKVKTGRFAGHLDESFLSAPGSGFALDDWLDGKRSWNAENRFINDRSMFSIEVFRYSRLLALYDQLFKKVHVFLYEDLEKDRAACLARLCSIMSCDLPSAEEGQSQKVVNRRLSQDRFRKRLARNRLEPLFSGSDSRTRKIVTKLLARRIPDRSDANRAHVLKLINERAIREDNLAIDRQFDLGMTRHPAHYFPEGSY